MKSKTGNIVLRKKRLLLLVIIPVVILFAFLYRTFDVCATGHYEGVFLLKGENGSPYEIKDDLYLGDESRYIFGIDLSILDEREIPPSEPPCLTFEWDEEDGSGYVRNYLPGGGQIYTSFSRFEYAEKASDVALERRVHGIFVGGGLPASIAWRNNTMKDETGMAYFDGTRWYHLWCSVNEGIASAVTKKQTGTADWRFLGSRVLNASDRELALTSEHEVVIDGVPLLVQKFAYFRAGRQYFILSTRITNRGNKPVGYYYSYGDEPWVGDFGSSKGNVGWVADGLIKHAQFVDTARYSYAGFFDYGNDAIGPAHNFTNVANFIEWFGVYTPTVYFSNGPEDFPENDGGQVPLSSNERFIGIIWGPFDLQPGQSDTYALVIGMAEYNPITGLPVKPAVKLKFIPR